MTESVRAGNFRPDSLQAQNSSTGSGLPGVGKLLGLAALAMALTTASAQEKTIKIGVPTAVQLQVGRDTQDAIKIAMDEINAKGGVLGRKLEMTVADETENPETGISAIKKLTADE
jgi:branched-chain amino acid transport system substrate-binding protein